MEKQISATVTRLNGGTQIPLTLTVHAGRQMVRVTVQMPTVNNVFVKLEKDTNGQDSIKIDHYDLSKKDNKSALCKFLNLPLSRIKLNTNIYLGVVDLTALNKEIEQLTTDGEAYKQSLIDAENALPRIKVAYDFLDWGDYNITQERRIMELRLENGEYVHHSILLNLDDKKIGDKQDLWDSILKTSETAKVKDRSSKYYIITDEQAAELIEWRKLGDKKESDEKEAKLTAAAEKRKEEEAAAATKLADLMENELMLFDASVIYASAGSQLIHSLAAVWRKDGTIGVYTTSYANDFKAANKPINTTYEIKGELAKNGFRWNGVEKHWEIETNDENGQKVIDLLKKYDSKATPSELRLQRCWECGCYSRKLDENGYCGC